MLHLPCRFFLLAMRVSLSDRFDPAILAELDLMAQAANASGCKRRRLDSRGPGETLDLDYDSKCNGSKCNGSECNGDTDADGNGYDGDGATEIVEVDLLKTLQFQRLLWPPRTFEDEVVVAEWNEAIKTALDAVDEDMRLRQKAIVSAGPRRRVESYMHSSAIDCSKWYSAPPSWDVPLDMLNGNDWTNFSVEGGPIWVWYVATIRDVLTKTNKQLLLMALLGPLGCGTREILNRFDGQNMTLLMHLINKLAPGAIIAPLLAHPFLDVHAYLAEPTLTRSALQVALRHDHLGATILVRLTDAQLRDLIFPGDGSVWPILFTASRWTTSHLFSSVLARVVSIFTPPGGGHCRGESTRYAESTISVSRSGGTCPLCRILRAETPKGHSMITSAMREPDDTSDDKWPLLVQQFSMASSRSCLVRLFLRNCWLPATRARNETPLHAPIKSKNGQVTGRHAESKGRGWKTEDPLRTAIRLGRDKDAVWLIRYCLPPWAADRYDCDGKTLLIRAVMAVPPKVEIVYALLQKAPHLDVNARALFYFQLPSPGSASNPDIDIHQDVRFDLTSPLLRRGADAAELIAKYTINDPIGNGAVLHDLVMAAIQSRATYVLHATDVMMRILCDFAVSRIVRARVAHRLPTIIVQPPRPVLSTIGFATSRDHHMATRPLADLSGYVSGGSMRSSPSLLPELALLVFAYANLIPPGKSLPTDDTLTS
jgi:hypothetical protein